MAIPEPTVRAMLATVREAALAGDLASTLVASLHRVVGADYVTYDDIRPDRTLKLGDPPGTPETDEAWARLGHEHPSLPYGLRSDARTVRLSDVASHRRLRGLELWTDVLEPLRIRYQLNVPLYQEGSRLIGVGLSRGGRDFTDSELAVVELLRVELSQIVAARDEEARNPLERAGLTHRERQVLYWLATGMRNKEIADELGLSPRTVSKHLEAIYRKLGVSTRAAAVGVTSQARATRTSFSVLPPPTGQSYGHHEPGR